MKTIIGVIMISVSLSSGCKKGSNESPENSNQGEWLIPASRVVDGGPGKDGIPALTTPPIVQASQITYLNDNDLVIGFKDDNTIKAYPHPILNWHEIINDNVGSKKISIIYCPLTGTGVGWNRDLPTGETTFGVSGLLYNVNVIPYDRISNSNWSQMLMKSVNGKLKGEKPENYQVIETTWKTWKQMFPNSLVVTTNTGFSRNYNSYPYGDYRTNNALLIFGIEPDDTRIPRKERVLGVFAGNSTRVYRFGTLKSNGGSIIDTLNGKQIVVIGDADLNIMTAFYNELPNGQTASFTINKTNGSGFFKDQFDNVWDVFGTAVSGPLAGQKLISPTFIIGYWMAFGTFYPGIKIFQ